jgi:transcriptional regulator with XRE-family HTH domain
MQKTARLRELRDRAALSQEDLAEKSGVSRGTIADLEAGKRPARPSTRRKLAKALGVQPDELSNSHGRRGGRRTRPTPENRPRANP